MELLLGEGGRGKNLFVHGGDPLLGLVVQASYVYALIHWGNFRNSGKKCFTSVNPLHCLEDEDLSTGAG